MEDGIVGFDENLRPVLSLHGAVGDSVNSAPGRIRTRSVTSKYRGRIQGISDGHPGDKLVIAEIHKTPIEESSLSHQDGVNSDSVLQLLQSPVTPSPDDTVTQQENASVSTQWSVPIDTEIEDHDYEDDDLQTIVPNSPNLSLSNSEEEEDSTEISNNVDELVGIILNIEMATEQSAAAQATKKTLKICTAVFEEEYDDFNLEELPSSEIQEMITKGKEMKDSLLKALTDAEDISEVVIGPELKNKGSQARKGFINFVKNGSKELRNRELNPTEPSSANISMSSTTYNKTKSTLVEKYTSDSVREMRELMDQLEELTVEKPENQTEFKGYEERVKSNKTKSDVIKNTAKNLIMNATECDITEECIKMEDLLRSLERKEISLGESLQKYRAT